MLYVIPVLPSRLDCRKFFGYPDHAGRNRLDLEERTMKCLSFSIS